jgi:hypothetical protein
VSGFKKGDLTDCTKIIIAANDQPIKTLGEFTTSLNNMDRETSTMAKGMVLVNNNTLSLYILISLIKKLKIVKKNWPKVNQKDSDGTAGYKADDR